MSIRSKLWIIATVCCLVLIVSAVTILLHTMGSNSVGAIRVGSQNTPAVHSKPVSVNTSYFTAILPATFSIKRQANAPPAPFLLQLEANTPATVDEQLAITVGKLPADGLRGIGDYNLRIKQSNVYSQTTFSNLPSHAIAFQNANPPAALTVFWPHGTRYAELTVSTSGGATYSQLKTIYGQIITQWKWK
jgi:predicted phage tail protein